MYVCLCNPITNGSLGWLNVNTCHEGHNSINLSNVNISATYVFIYTYMHAINTHVGSMRVLYNHV